MKQTVKHRASKWLYLSMLLLTVGLYLILTFALTLPFNRIQGNAVQSATVLPTILLTLIELVEICVYALGASWILFSAYRPFSVGTTLRLGGIYVFCALLRYAFSLINAWMLYGTRVFFHMMLEPNLIHYAPYFLLDILFALLVVVVGQVSADRYYYKRGVVSKASVLLNHRCDEIPNVEAFYPFRKVISFKNPLQACTLTVAIVLAVCNLLSDLLFVRYTSVLSAIGGYAADLLMGVVFYILCVVIFRLLFAKQDRLSK